MKKKESIIMPMRPMNNERLASKNYKVEELVDETCLKSLMTESKKIPLSINPPNYNEKLTMSKIEDYAVENKSKFRPKPSWQRKSSLKGEDSVN
jgi:hypothetical protein